MFSEDTDAGSFLLLLPPTPTPFSHEALKEAYADTLSQVLKEVASASHASRDAAVLEIALACPHLVGERGRPRSASYALTQSILAGVYKLICLVAAQEKVNIEDADGVDVRVLIIAWSPDATSNSVPSHYGPVIDLQCLAGSQRAWQYAFGVESEEGEAFVRAFVTAKNGSVSAPDLAATQIPEQRSLSEDSAKGSDVRHYQVAVGGTFDHIHLGHKLLLTMTLFAVDEQGPSSPDLRVVVVGVTGDELLKNKKYAEQLESWHSRQQSVVHFLRSLLDFSPPGVQEPSVKEVNEPGPNGHAVSTTFPSGLEIRCVEIWDPFGPTITEQSISGLIVSGETRSGGKAVNDKRAESGWSALQVFEVDVLDPEESQGSSSDQQAKDQDSFASKLSSTETRRKLHAKATASL